jgi:hypothetical protein
MKPVLTIAQRHQALTLRYHLGIYHAETQLPDGRVSLLIDPGSRGNLCGSVWAQKSALAAIRAGRTKDVAQIVRKEALNVQGVGNGSQRCTYDCKLPIAIRDKTGKVTTGNFITPVVDNSDLPGLLGLESMRANRGILDMHNNIYYMCGPGGANIELSPGSRAFKLLEAPSGHLVLPCSEFDGARGSNQNMGSLSLNPPTDEITLITNVAEEVEDQTTSGPQVLS